MTHDKFIMFDDELGGFITEQVDKDKKDRLWDNKDLRERFYRIRNDLVDLIDKINNKLG